MADLKGQITGSSVDVQMEARRGDDLSETIDKIRQQYEKATQKRREETEAWYQAKVRTKAIHPVSIATTTEQPNIKFNLHSGQLHPKQSVLN